MMKVLWVTNMPLHEVSEALNIEGTLSQSWLVELWKTIRESGFIVCSAALSKVNELKKVELYGGNHYVIPVVSKYTSEKAYEKHWIQIIEAENPDLIHIHGTEYRHPLPLLKHYPNIKSMLTVQGMMGRISDEFYGGLDWKELIRFRTSSENLHLGGMIGTRVLYKKQAKTEKKLLQLVNCVTGRTLWDYSLIKQMNPNAKYFKCTYNLREQFYSADKWNIDFAERYSIYTAFSSYPLKGLHILLKAIAIVKNEYPLVKVYVPGIKGDKNGRLLANTGYTKYIKDLIEKKGIRENVIFLGGQTVDDVVSHMQKANICVVSSAIEGASATLREAMHIGTPCICAYRGGMTELLKDRESGFYYDYSEYPYLAERIMQIFADDSLAKRFSVRVIEDAEKMHDKKKNDQSWLDAYHYALYESCDSHAAERVDREWH